MTDNPQLPRNIGSHIQWSDEDIARLVGIDEDGNMNPVYEAEIKAFLRSTNPTLYGLINAEIDESDE